MEILLYKLHKDFKNNNFMYNTCHILEPSLNAKFKMRETFGVTIVSNEILYVYNNWYKSIKSELSKSDINKLNCLITIKNFKGYWSWGIYEGDEPDSDRGENIIVAIDDHEYILIEGGSVRRFETDDVLENAFYVVCSGGDPGTLFATSKNWIYSFGESYPGLFRYKRNHEFELECGFQNKPIQDIVDIYLTLLNCASRGFGYHQRDISEMPIKINMKDKENLITSKSSVIVE